MRKPSEGELRRAKIVFLFCLYDQNQSWDRDGRILQEVANDTCRIEQESNSLVEEGIRRWDQGQRRQALELYHAALDIFPKNPWALWELALDHLTFRFVLIDNEANPMPDRCFSIILDLD